MEMILLLLAVLILSGCLSPEPYAPKTPQPIAMPNPAAVYCTHKGGESIRVITDLGGRSDCILPGGERIDEWTLYRRDHEY